MGTVVAVVNLQEGIGKTTLAVHLAAWSQDRIGPTAFVDTRVRGAGCAWMRQVSPPTQAHRLLTVDAILDQVPALAVQFAVLVMVGPSGLPELARAMCLTAHLVLVPCGDTAAAVGAAHAVAHLLGQARQIRGGRPQAMLIPNLLRPRSRRPRPWSEALMPLGIPVLGGLHRDPAFVEAAAQRTLVWRMGTRARRAAEQMTALLAGLGLHDTPSDGGSGGPLHRPHGPRRNVGVGP